MFEGLFQPMHLLLLFFLVVFLVCGWQWRKSSKD
jgi:hypothetical protein